MGINSKIVRITAVFAIHVFNKQPKETHLKTLLVENIPEAEADAHGNHARNNQAMCQVFPSIRLVSVLFVPNGAREGVYDGNTVYYIEQLICTGTELLSLV